MGVQLTPLACKLQSKMKSVAVAALCLFAAVAADAESKPEAGADAYYGHYGYGLAHHGYGYGLAHHGYYGYANPYAYGHYYGKRSADAEPEADAYYGHHYGYGLAHHGYGYAHHGYYGYPYAHHGYYYGKRSADAEAEPAADAYYGHHYGYAPYGYAHRGYYGYPYAHHGYY